MPNEIIASLNQISQIGVEAPGSPGAPVAATRRLQAMGFPINPNEDIEVFQPPGAALATQAAINREWGEGSVGDGSGLAYNEIPFALASVLSRPADGTPRALGSVVVPRSTFIRKGDYYRPAADNGHIYIVTVGGITGSAEPAGLATATAEGATVTDGAATLMEIGVSPSPLTEWIFDLSTWVRDLVQTYTIETGDKQSGRSMRAAHAFFTSIGINSTRSGRVAVTGNLLASALEDPFAMTANVAESEMVPATPAHLNVYMDDTHQALGGTLLDGNFTAEFGVGDRAGHVWFHTRAKRGPADRVATRPTATLSLTQADGSEVDSMVAALRQGMKKFFKVEYKGPFATPRIQHELSIMAAAQIGDNRDWGDQDGVWGATVPMRIMHSPDWGRGLRVRCVTTLNALA